MRQTLPFEQLLPFASRHVDEVYRTAEASEGRIVPAVPAIGVIMRSLISRGTNAIPGHSDADLQDLTSAHQADAAFYGHMRRAVSDKNGKANYFLSSLGQSIVMGLAVDSADAQGALPPLRTEAEVSGYQALVGKALESEPDPEDGLFSYASTRTGLDTLRVAQGFSRRMTQTFTEGVNPQMLHDPRFQQGVTNMIGLGMLQGYWNVGGE